jgi:hypothetical protein
MPQTKVEKKFFRLRVAKFFLNIASIIVKSLTLIEFQELQKNIAGGVE